MSYIVPADNLPAQVDDVSSVTTNLTHLPRATKAQSHASAHRDPEVTTSPPLMNLPLSEVKLTYDDRLGVLWQYMQPKGRPSFTPGLLRDMTLALDLVEKAHADGSKAISGKINYLVLASNMPGIFNLGGDLPHFMKLIEDGNQAKLSWYARVCARGQYRRAVKMNLPICTIALVQGDALGGGFEAALAHDVIIAERGTSFGLPEVLFNMFPGMGAYSFLARRLNPIQAEQMILSGKIYKAEELNEMGVIDRLADVGCGGAAVEEFIHEFERARLSRQALLKARNIVQPISLEEMIDIADLWVEAAMELTPADRRKMSHLAKAQDRRWRRIVAHNDRLTASA